MSKGMDSKKSVKKEPLKTAKEKKNRNNFRTYTSSLQVARIFFEIISILKIKEYIAQYFSIISYQY